MLRAVAWLVSTVAAVATPALAQQFEPRPGLDRGKGGAQRAKLVDTAIRDRAPGAVHQGQGAAAPPDRVFQEVQRDPGL